jgi:hypothetical protein
MIYRTFQLFIEHRETGSFWVAILDGNVRKEHPDALEAIIRTGVCEDKGTVLYKERYYFVNLLMVLSLTADDRDDPK